MGTLFKLLRNELLSLGLLLFVLVPFVNGLVNDHRAPAGVQEFAYKAESIISSGLGSFGGFGGGMVGSPINLGGMPSGGGSTAFYTSGAPIYMPES